MTSDATKYFAISFSYLFNGFSWSRCRIQWNAENASAYVSCIKCVNKTFSCRRANSIDTYAIGKRESPTFFIGFNFIPVSADFPFSNRFRNVTSTKKVKSLHIRTHATQKTTNETHLKSTWFVFERMEISMFFSISLSIFLRFFRYYYFAHVHSSLSSQCTDAQFAISELSDVFSSITSHRTHCRIGFVDFLKCERWRKKNPKNSCKRSNSI